MANGGLNKEMGAAAELGRNPVSKYQIRPEYACLSICRSGMRGGSLLLFFLLLFYFFPSPPIRSGEVFSSVIFFPLFLFFCLCFLDAAMVWKGKPASVTTGSRDRTKLCAEIIIIIIWR